ncbi:MAG: arginine deiminase-related protein [Acidobacteriota bacterium]
MLVAITREVSPRLAECELSFQDRQLIDVARAREQHAAYRTALTELGARVITLPTLPEFADCVFVEDPAVVLDEVAILTRLGAESRCGESASLAEELAQRREVLRMVEPGTLDGGDVMRIEKTLYVGLSGRTNFAGIQQLAKLVQPFGYWVTPIEVRGCLHLKSACSYLGDATILANRACIDTEGLCGIKILDVPAHEPQASNTLLMGDQLLMPSSYPATRDLLQSHGFAVRTVDISELIKAEAGVTCLSLIFDAA